MIDLHCHILPGVDDGPASLAESLQMAETAVAGNIHTLVATPHADTGVYCFTPADIAERVAGFNAELAAAAIPLQVYPGAEVQLSPGLAERLHQGKVTTINNTRYVLLELPPTLLPASGKNELFSLLDNGFIPIIAHPELHPYLQRHPAYIGDLVQMGVLCQITAQSLVGAFGWKIKKVAEQMLRNRLVHIIASDAHGTEGRVVELDPAVTAATRVLASHEKALHLVTHVPAAIIGDSDIEVDPPAENMERGRKIPWHDTAGSLFSAISNWLH